MGDAIIAGISSIVVGLLAFLGVWITNKKSNQDMVHKVETTQAVTNERIDELTREVRMHNDFARRIPVLDTKIENLEKQINKQ